MRDPDFPDPRAEAGWVGQALRGQVVMVPEAGHYLQSQRPDVTTGAVLRFLESVQGRAEGGARPGQQVGGARWITGEVAVPQSRR